MGSNKLTASRENTIKDQLIKLKCVLHTPYYTWLMLYQRQIILKNVLELDNKLERLFTSEIKKNVIHEKFLISKRDYIREKRRVDVAIDQFIKANSVAIQKAVHGITKSLNWWDKQEQIEKIQLFDILRAVNQIIDQLKEKKAVEDPLKYIDILISSDSIYRALVEQGHHLKPIIGPFIIWVDQLVTRYRLYLAEIFSTKKMLLTQFIQVSAYPVLTMTDIFLEKMYINEKLNDKVYGLYRDQYDDEEMAFIKLDSEYLPLILWWKKNSYLFTDQSADDFLLFEIVKELDTLQRDLKVNYDTVSQLKAKYNDFLEVFELTESSELLIKNAISLLNDICLAINQDIKDFLDKQVQFNNKFTQSIYYEYRLASQVLLVLEKLGFNLAEAPFVESIENYCNQLKSKDIHIEYNSSIRYEKWLHWYTENSSIMDVRLFKEERKIFQLGLWMNKADSMWNDWRMSNDTQDFLEQFNHILAWVDCHEDIIHYSEREPINWLNMFKDILQKKKKSFYEMNLDVSFFGNGLKGGLVNGVVIHEESNDTSRFRETDPCASQALLSGA